MARREVSLGFNVGQKLLCMNDGEQKAHLLLGERLHEPMRELLLHVGLEVFAVVNYLGLLGVRKDGLGLFDDFRRNDLDLLVDDLLVR